jgi:hypothetical protein
VQGRDAHGKRYPGRPARPMVVMHAASPSRGAPAVSARSRARGIAVRAAVPSLRGSPPSPGVNWRRSLMMSGPPLIPPGRQVSGLPIARTVPAGCGHPTPRWKPCKLLSHSWLSNVTSPRRQPETKSAFARRTR